MSISISTLEHVGWDEQPRKPEKIFYSIKNLKKLLAPGGRLIVTLPLGENLALDQYLATDKIKFTENYYLKRISKSNKWEELKSSKFDLNRNFKFSGAQIVLIGIYYNNDNSELEN